MNPLVSTTRLPLDHMISGALIAGITVGGLSYGEYKRGEISCKKAAKRTIKLGIQGGIATACAISASNKLVMRNYLGAVIVAAIGVGGVVAAEKLINLEDGE